MPVNIADASALLSAIASTAKIIEFGFNMKDRHLSAKQLAEVEVEAQAQAKLRFSTNSVTVQHIASSSISEELVRATTEVIEKIRDKLIHVIGNDGIPQSEKDSQFRHSRYELCSHINRLKFFLGDKLPPDLMLEWNNARCEQLNYTI